MSVIAPVFSFDLNGYTGSGLALQDKAEKSLMQITIGIDISKETLDAYRLPDNKHIQVANGRAGHKTLVRWIGKQNGSLVVFEATGAYHRNLEAALAANGTAFAKVNPRQARRFAEATGRLAKTDRVDAIMLAKMGAILGLKAHEPRTEALHILRELITARRALMKDKVAARPGCRQPDKPCSKIRSMHASNRSRYKFSRLMPPSPKRLHRMRRYRTNSTS